MKSKVQLSIVMGILMLLLVVVDVSATNIQTTRRVNSHFMFDRAYGGSTEFFGQNIMPTYAQMSQTTRRVFSNNFVYEVPAEQSRLNLAFADPLQGDGSFMTTRRVSSAYELNRGYGGSRSFQELMFNGVFITF